MQIMMHKRRKKTDKKDFIKIKNLFPTNDPVK